MIFTATPSRNRTPRSFRVLFALACLLPGGGLLQAAEFPEDPLAWPKVSCETRPWTRWWWLGSAVEPAEITRELEAFASAGIGGVEICPIYGAVGAESRFVPYLSGAWVSALEHTLKEAARLGMKVDLTTGTGWPFGGSQVDESIASSNLSSYRKVLQSGQKLVERLPKGRLICLLAESAGQRIDLSPSVRDGQLEWTTPAGDWTVRGLFTTAPIQKVKRAAPGGEGNVLDPFSPEAMDRYFQPFEKALAGLGPLQPRAHFHDSFEYYQAAWTPLFEDRFEKRRGYSLQSQLAAFQGDGAAETVSRVRSDYRLTLDELHREYLQRWHDRVKAAGSITRNQAHGSPGNLLDHYAVSEIPETEIFQDVSEDQIPMLRFASSAAHLSGRRLSSCESFTWLDEHFQVKPRKLKDAADFVFLSGANHLFFHGIPYSPPDAGWPGWLFYASTHMGENGGLWRDLPAFSAYLRRCQSVLQEGSPSADALLYFPMEDIRARDEGMLPLLTVHDQAKWLWPTPFYKTSMELWAAGHPFDFVSDRLLEKAVVENGRILLGGNRYPVLNLSGVQRIPLETMRKVLSLADAGATVVFTGGLPADVPGFAAHDERLAELLRLIKPLSGGRSEVAFGSGRILLEGGSLVGALKRLEIRAETMTASGLRFVRRSTGSGYHYFIVNRSPERFSGIVRPSVPFRSALLLDPWSDAGAGKLAISGNGRESGFQLELDPGESCVVRTFTDLEVDAPSLVVDVPAGDPVGLNGPWVIDFIEGGPSLPKSLTIERTACWTAGAVEELKAFSGTARYRTSVRMGDPQATRWMLDLGTVAETARVTVNGRSAGVSWAPPHRLEVSGLLKQGDNTIEVEVTNLAANRIADLDRRGVPWKRFHEINFVNLAYKPFDASAWPVIDSGLAGPVRLLPLKR